MALQENFSLRLRHLLIILNLGFGSSFFTSIGVSMVFSSHVFTFLFLSLERGLMSVSFLGLALQNDFLLLDTWSLPGSEPHWRIFQQPYWEGAARISAARLGLSGNTPWADCFSSPSLAFLGKTEWWQNFSHPAPCPAQWRSQPRPATTCRAQQGPALLLSSALPSPLHPRGQAAGTCIRLALPGMGRKCLQESKK